MTKWIAFPAAGLLFAAAWARPAPELLSPRRPVSPVLGEVAFEPPAQASPRRTFLDALTGALMPSIPGATPSRFHRPDERAEIDGDPTIEAIQRKLETMKIDLDFENTKLEDILSFIRDVSGLNILLDAAVREPVDPDKSITFKVRDLVLKNVLKLLLAQFLLDYRITEEGVVLLTDFRRLSMHDGGRDILKLITPSAVDPLVGVLRIDLDLTDTPLWRVAELLQTMTGVSIRVLHAGDDNVSLKVRDVSLRTALELLLRPRDMVFAWEAGELQIRSRLDPDRY